MIKKSGAVLFLLAAGLVVGCGGTAEAPKSEAPKAAAPVVENSTKAPLSQNDELRRKANFTEAASLVGYDGKAIKDNLHKIIDIQEEEAKRLEDLKDIR